MTPRTHIKNANHALLDSFNTARSRHQMGDIAGAEAIYSRLLAIDPADDEVLLLFGMSLVGRGDLSSGLECIALARTLNPENPGIPYAQGVYLQRADRLSEACTAYQACLSLAPNHQEALENLAAAFYDTNQFDDGLVAAQKALVQSPGSRLAIRAVANCLTGLGRRTESLAVLRTGLKAHPAAPELRIHYAWELMANGDFENGFIEHEWRNQRSLQKGHVARQVPFPRWQGESLQGKSILLYGDEGIGDELMFAPHVLALAQTGVRCILECEQRLVSLFARSLPNVNLLPRNYFSGIDWDERLVKVDYAISTASLPMHVTSPLRGSAFLRADQVRVDAWRAKLTAIGTGLKIGISWRGGADPKAHALRSIAHTIFGELIDPNAHFINLQYGASAQECAAISPRVHYLADVDALRDLEEFSALIVNLDLVISVDNSTVHFAAALGVPTWVLLPRYSEWRWGRNETDASRWYQGLRFFRQQEAGDTGWRDVIAQARKALLEFVPVLGCQMPDVTSTSNDMVLPPARPGRKALVIGDTQYWYHWGCSCTSLGLHQGLRKQFAQIATLPLSQILVTAPGLVSLADLGSDFFFSNFQTRCPELVSKMSAADVIFVNGEGSIHGAGAPALSLLYLAYVAKTRLGKPVQIVNHSCFPGNGFMPDGQTTLRDLYATVYRTIDLAVLREQRSFDNVQSMGGRAVLGFDCLPLFLETWGVVSQAHAKPTIVFGGSVAWTPALIEHFAALTSRLSKQGYEIIILSGAKAYLADDEIGFIDGLVTQLNRLTVDHQLHFALSERDWLQTIADAALVVSGRFHYSIAAAFLKVPFIVAESNTATIDGLLEALCLPIDAVSLQATDLPGLMHKAELLLAQPEPGLVSSGTLMLLRDRARRNFEDGCNHEQAIAPVMLRAYSEGSKGATAFFRNRPFLETFCKLLTERGSRPCSVLVHASSIGAEPWSLALWWLHRVFPITGCEIEIVATDLNPGFLTFAQIGVYPAEVLRGLSGEEQRWFDRVGDHLRVPDCVRKNVSFVPAMNFIDGDPGRVFDAVLVMNALTYVTPVEQTRALHRISAYTKTILGITSFHPDTIRADVAAINFEPCLLNQRHIHEAWGDRLRSDSSKPGTPEYSWQLPPYDLTVPDAQWRFASLFTRQA